VLGVAVLAVLGVAVLGVAVLAVLRRRYVLTRRTVLRGRSELGVGHVLRWRSELGVGHVLRWRSELGVGHVLRWAGRSRRPGLPRFPSPPGRGRWGCTVSSWRGRGEVLPCQWQRRSRWRGRSRRRGRRRRGRSRPCPFCRRRRVDPAGRFVHALFPVIATLGHPPVSQLSCHGPAT